MRAPGLELDHDVDVALRTQFAANRRPKQRQLLTPYRRHTAARDGASI
jgi:hypothetical protein